MLKAKKLTNDTSITSLQNHIYSPYTTSFNNSDEIRIAIQSQNAYLLPHDSSILIECDITIDDTILNPDGATSKSDAYTVDNFAAFLFDSIKYELNGVEIDNCRNVGITSLMKGRASFTPDECRGLEISTFGLGQLVAKASKATIIMPLRMYLGFAEDYQSIIINQKHELILQRSKNDLNCFYAHADAAKIKINRIQWRMPHVKVDDYTQIRIMKQIESDDPIDMAFRSWELHEYPVLPISNKQVWTVRTSSNLMRPRYIILGFQTARNYVIQKNITKFDGCTINNVKLYLNTNVYPEENMNINFLNGQYTILYEMYKKFQSSYYHGGVRSAKPYLTLSQFSTAPLFVFDCSRQDESVKSSSIDVRIEILSDYNMPAETSAYCLIIHDNVMKYRPLTSITTRNI